MNDVRMEDLLAISSQAPSRERRIAARLLANALGIEILFKNIPELMIVAGPEVGLAVAREMELLAKDFDLLPRLSDRLRAAITADRLG